MGCLVEQQGTCLLYLKGTLQRVFPGAYILRTKGPAMCVVWIANIKLCVLQNKKILFTGSRVRLSHMQVAEQGCC